MSTIEFEPIRIDTGSDDEDGRLILVDGRLIGVLVRLDAEEQAPLIGFWSLEAAFGNWALQRPEPFKDLREAAAWVSARHIPTPTANR